MEECLNAWKFARNPFRSASGPLIAPADLADYHDFYRWVDLQKLGGLTAEGRVLIADLSPSPGRMMLLLLSGAQGCGRSSLESLLSYETIQRFKTPPITPKLTLTNVLDKRAIAIAMARALSVEVKKHSLEASTALGSTIDSWRDDNPPGVEPMIDTLFDRLRSEMQTSLPDVGVILTLDAIRHSVTRDTAQACAAMPQGLADFVILILTNHDDAQFIRSSSIRKGQPVALVDAPRLDLVTTRAVLEKRLKNCRVPGAITSVLYPFTDDALAALFEPSPNFRDQTIKLPIRVAMQKLADAAERKCSASTSASTDLGVIDAADIRKTLGL